MRTDLSLILRLLLIFVVLGVLSARVSARIESSEPRQGPVMGRDARHDTSPPLRDLPPITTTDAVAQREMTVPGETNHLYNLPPVVDSVRQSSFGTLGAHAIPAPLVTFDGIPNRNGLAPPDTNGDVGPHHYAQIVNVSFQVFDKSGRSLYGPVDNKTLWQGFGSPCETRNDGDPIVLYDPLDDRWFISQFTTSNPYGMCIAVSKSGDPTGAWHRYWFKLSSTEFYDYEKYGVWPDGYYMGANRFSGSSFAGPTAVVFERPKMLRGETATYQEFKQASSAGTLLPADIDGKMPPPNGAPNTFASISSSSLRLWKFTVDWANSSNSKFSGPTSLSVAAYNKACIRQCAPQPSTTQKLDAIGDRLMFRLAYRNFGSHEALVVNHTVNAGNGTLGVRWYEVRNPSSSPTLHQQGTYAPDSTNRWMGSIAMDKAGNIGLGYSVSSSSTNPSIRYTGRLASDPLGQLPQGEGTIKEGGGAQTGVSRWGDYSSMSIDPADDCTFWYTTEYYASSSSRGWRTHIGAFKFPSCDSTTTPTPVTPTPTPLTPTPTPGTITPTPVTPTRTPVTPTPVTPTPGVEPWQPNTQYAVGAMVSYNRVIYRCKLRHTSWTGGEPPKWPLLWERVS